MTNSQDKLRSCGPGRGRARARYSSWLLNSLKHLFVKVAANAGIGDEKSSRFDACLAGGIIKVVKDRALSFSFL